MKRTLIALCCLLVAFAAGCAKEETYEAKPLTGNGAIRFLLNFYTENNSGGGTGLGDVILHIQNGTEETLYRTSSSADFYRLADDLDRTNLLDAGIGGTRVYADGDDSWIYAKKRNSQFYSHAYYQEGSSETNQTVKGDPWQTDVYDAPTSCR